MRGTSESGRALQARWSRSSTVQRTAIATGSSITPRPSVLTSREDSWRACREMKDAAFMSIASKRTRVLSMVVAVAFIIGAMIAGYVNIGVPPVVIVGGSGVV